MGGKHYKQASAGQAQGRQSWRSATLEACRRYCRHYRTALIELQQFTDDELKAIEAATCTESSTTKRSLNRELHNMASEGLLQAHCRESSGRRGYYTLIEALQIDTTG